jgi:hypothetical protein
LERKATFISQVMHGRLDSREISDIGDTALSFSEVKALATGNPLLMDKAKADADAAFTRLQRAERAWHRNQAALQDVITQHENAIETLTRKSADVDLAISERQNTRGDAFIMTIDGQDCRSRPEAGQRVKDRLAHEVTELSGLRSRAGHLGSFGSFPLVADTERALGKTSVTISLDGVPESAIRLSAADLEAADPAGLITRIENRLYRLETSRQETLGGIELAHREIAHARDGLGQPFPQASQLAEARNRARTIDAQLDQIVADQHKDTEPEQRPVSAVPSSHAVPEGAMAVDADWRDQVIQTGRDAWLPKPVAAYEAGAAHRVEHESPEIGS